VITIRVAKCWRYSWILRNYRKRRKSNSSLTRNIGKLILCF